MKKYRPVRKGRCKFETGLQYNILGMAANEKTSSTRIPRINGSEAATMEMI